MAAPKTAVKSNNSREELLGYYRQMLLIRRFEEQVEKRFRAGELPGFLHVAIGQEAVAVGVVDALGDDDVFASTHRAHGHTLACIGWLTGGVHDAAPCFSFDNQNLV